MRTLKVAGFLTFTSLKKGNRGVALLTILVLVLVTLNLLFVPSLLRGLVGGANDKLKDTFAGDIVIESALDNPLIPGVDQLIPKIEAIDGVIAATPRNSLVAEISFENQRTSGIIYGISPEAEKAVFTISKSLIEGSFLEANDRAQIILGIQLAGAGNPNIELYSRSLKKVHTRDKILVTYGNGVRKSYTVKGIFYSEFIQTDTQAFVSEAEFESVNPLAANKASSIRVKIDDTANAASIIEKTKQLGDGLRILTWEDYAGIMRSMTDSFHAIDTILNVVNLLVAGITVFVVTYIDVTNRRRQIGIQRAIGIMPGCIAIAYLLRAAFYTAIAAILASLTFLYVILPVEAKYPFHFPFGDVNLIIGVSALANAFLILLCATIAAAFLPVWIALRIKILDAIWG
ncbi:MAG: FtsX-like permease family protein [Chloroflexi bacterium]|nr:FtsX-like permease family protein [Chloroflexota bacterium]